MCKNKCPMAHATLHCTSGSDRLNMKFNEIQSNGSDRLNMIFNLSNPLFDHIFNQQKGASLVQCILAHSAYLHKFDLFLWFFVSDWSRAENCFAGGDSARILWECSIGHWQGWIHCTEACCASHASPGQIQWC